MDIHPPDEPQPELNEIAPPPIPARAQHHEAPVDVVYFLTECVQRGASDLHLTVGATPMARVFGTLVPLADYELDGEMTRDLILSILTESQRARLEESWELDFALAVEGLGRFRGNAHYSRGALEAAFRYIPDSIPALENLGHTPTIHKLCDMEQGLVLVTGITGSGKSTTLAAMVQEIAAQRSGIIVSIEDPIEYVFSNQLSLIKQREVGSDTKGFATALRHALRQDPDVIMVSEMRDLETMQTAITAAETGHLVLATVHTIDAPKAIDRIIDAFPADQQSQMIAQLTNCLRAVVSQRLLPRADGKGRCLATETMVVNDAIKSTMRDRRYEQLLGLIEIGHKDGMNTIDESLAHLVREELITPETALRNARYPDRIQNAVKQGGKKGLFG